MNKKKCLKIFFAVFGFLFFIQQFALCSSVYVSAGSNLVEVDLNSGQTHLIASLADYTDQSPRGVARNSEGEIYVSVSNNWSNRILKINPNGSQEPTIEYFTSPISFRYGFGQLDFNSKGHLFAAGDKNQVIYEFDQQGNKVSDIGLDGGYSSYKNNVGLFTNGDILYSVGYFSPRVLSRYDTSGEVITGGVYDELTFSSEFYPASLTQSHNGNLAIGGGRGGTLLWEYDLTTKTTSLLFDCKDFGRSTFVQYDPFSNSYIVPSNNGLTLLNPDGSFIKEITGPDLQNSRSISKPFVIPEPTTVVAVDIKPGSCPNPLNVKSKGVLPVAILGTADYDIKTIDPTSVRLAGVEPLRSGYEDVATPVLDADECNCTEAGPDGFLDLTLKFKTQRIVEAVGDVNHGDELVLELTGVLYDEMPIEGADCILIRGSHKPLNPADINKDGMVNAVDFVIFVKNWLQSSIVGCQKSKDIPTITAQELEGNFSYTTEEEDHAFWLRGFRNSDGKLVFKFIKKFYNCEPVFEKYSINSDQAEIVFKLIPYKQAIPSKDRLKVVLKKTNENIFQGQIFQTGKKKTIATFKKRHDYMNTAPFEGLWSHSFEIAGKKRTHILRCFKDDMGRPKFNFLRQYYSHEPVFTECSFSTVRPNQIEIKFKLTQYESGGDRKHSLKYILESEDGVLVGKLYESWREPVDVTLVPYQ